MAKSHYKVVFTDVGGVIATNGWGTELRQRMVEHFGLAGDDVYRRHVLMFDSYERGYLNFDEYLRWTVFHEPRPFGVEEVKQWIYAQGRPMPGTFDLYKRVKERTGVKFAVISNEGGGLSEDRVRRFKLDEIADFMIFSYAVHMRKPDPGIWKLALGLAQVNADESIYIDDRKLFVDFAAELGFQAYQHTSAEETGIFLESMGLGAE